MIEYTWDDLEYEIAATMEAGLPVAFWWRDDDAADDTPALRQLGALAASEGVPVAIAAIPASLTDEGAARLSSMDEAVILQHGYAHTNHAGPSEKKQELGAHRPASEVWAELQTGWSTLETALEAKAMPVLAPPWNRISDDVVAGLADAGYSGLSQYEARRTPMAAPGLTRANAHVDLIDWKGTRRFVGTGAALALACQHLADKRAGRVDASEPTGLLTHHLVMDMSAWAFAGAFIRRTKALPGVTWPAIAGIFAPEGGPGDT